MKLMTSYLCLMLIQAAGSQEILLRKNGASLQKVSTGIYAILHEDATDEWPHGNTGVIIGERDVMVVDACYLPSMARTDIELIRTITKKPVKYLAITHWHFDHNNGMSVYKDSFPGVSIIAEKESAKYIELNATWWAKRSVAQGSAKRKSLNELEQTLQQGKDTSGKELSSAEKEKLDKVIQQRRNELAELSELKTLLPDRTFSSSLIIDLGNQKVVIEDRGKANSPHDLTIYVPANKVLFTGDILVQTPLPYLGASWPVPWVNVLSALEKIPIKWMILGHGPVQSDHSYTKLVKEFLQSLLIKEEKLIREGKTIEQVQELINMDEFRKGPWAGDDPILLSDWKQNLNVIIERAWRGIRGQG